MRHYKRRARSTRQSRSRLRIELLEQRQVLSASGFVAGQQHDRPERLTADSINQQAHVQPGVMNDPLDQRMPRNDGPASLRSTSHQIPHSEQVSPFREQPNGHAQRNTPNRDRPLNGNPPETKPTRPSANSSLTASPSAAFTPQSSFEIVVLVPAQSAANPLATNSILSSVSSLFNTPNTTPAGNQRSGLAITSPVTFTNLGLGGTNASISDTNVVGGLNATAGIAGMVDFGSWSYRSTIETAGESAIGSLTSLQPLLWAANAVDFLPTLFTSYLDSSPAWAEGIESATSFWESFSVGDRLGIPGHGLKSPAKGA